MADEHWEGALENGGVDEDELIPLPTAATIAYYQVTKSERHYGSQVEAAEIMQAAAIALSTVAPVYWGTTRLTTREVEDALYRPLKDKADRQMRYTIHSYATQDPVGLRYGNRGDLASTRDPAAVQNATPGRDSPFGGSAGVSAGNGLGASRDEGIGES